jgi:hypothetical protein
MIEQDDIENLEEAQEKLQSSEVDEEYLPEIMGALVDSESSIRKISTSSDVEVTQDSEPIEIEIQESILETDEGKEAVSHICENSDATKKVITSALVLVESDDEVTQEEIKNFSGYSDTTEISRACKKLKDMGILLAESTEEDMEVVTFTEDWVENLIKIPEMKRKQQEILDNL